MKRLPWKFDLLVYRLFYWRWSRRLKDDPDLAYIFAEIGAEWSKAHPPRNPETINQLLEVEHDLIRSDKTRTVCLERDVVKFAKARRLAEQSYLNSDDGDAERLLSLLGEAEEKLDQSVDRLLELEGG